MRKQNDVPLIRTGAINNALNEASVTISISYSEASECAISSNR